jgi:SAM-dependent MidA family methyltransferase
MPGAARGHFIDTIPTPALVLDAAKVRRNIERMATYTKAVGIANRPHTKTHKSIAIAGLQLAAGAVGLTVAKVGEAETLALAFADRQPDILVAYPAVDPARTVRLGATRNITGRCVVFSNELFDAQPFRRLTFRRGAWRELGVELRDARLDCVELAAAVPASFPAEAPEGYIIDAAIAAAELLASIIKEPWTGLFVACDYGKSWAELATNTPEGTARAYFRHTQSNALLANAGQQDLTCHICWDWLVDQLNLGGFTNSKIESQESFLIRHAGEFISGLATAEAPRLSQRKLAVMHLIHPSHLGQKFQVLHASRA